MKDVNKILHAVSEVEQDLYNSGDVLSISYEDRRYIVVFFSEPIGGLNGIRIAKDGTLKTLRKLKTRIEELKAAENLFDRSNGDLMAGR